MQNEDKQKYFEAAEMKHESKIRFAVVEPGQKNRSKKFPQKDGKYMLFVHHRIWQNHSVAAKMGNIPELGKSK